MSSRHVLPLREQDFSLGFNGTSERRRGELVFGNLFPSAWAWARRLAARSRRTTIAFPAAIPWRCSAMPTGNRDSPATASILGKTVAVNGHNFTLVGVAQKGFDGVDLGNPSQIFVPVMMRPQLMPRLTSSSDFHNRRTRWVNVFGRLKPGVSRQQAQASLQPYFHGMLEMEVKEAAFNKASAEVRARFLQNVIQLLPGSQGQAAFPANAVHSAVGADGADGRRIADCLRERGQSADRARGFTAEGDRHPAGHRRWALPHHSPIAGGEPAAVC